MTPQEQQDFDALKLKLSQTDAALKQEQGKRIAVERENAEIKRSAKQTEEHANAYRAETDKAMLEAADQMKLYLCISQGVFALGQMGRSYMARKVSAARVVHREQENCLLMEQVCQAVSKGDQSALKALCEKMNGVINTIRGDGEAARLAAAEAALGYGIKEFGTVFDRLVKENNNGQLKASEQIQLTQNT